MRQEQYEKLQTLADELTDKALLDANPDGWAGAGKTAAQMDRLERGDAYWSRKMAMSTLSVLMRVTSLVTVVQNQKNSSIATTSMNEAESELDKEIASAEREANKLLDKLQQQQRKANFNKRAHGSTH